MNANKIVKKKTNEKNEKYAKKCVKKNIYGTPDFLCFLKLNKILNKLRRREQEREEFV